MPKGVDHKTIEIPLDEVPAVQKSLMPKGVDHSSIAKWTAFAWSVQKSLMPKGVDHTVQIDYRDALEVCKNL